jgi:hypothetical protein
VGIPGFRCVEIPRITAFLVSSYCFCEIDRSFRLRHVVKGRRSFDFVIVMQFDDPGRPFQEAAEKV